jgi:hypothetical protein
VERLHLWIWVEQRIVTNFIVIFETKLETKEKEIADVIQRYLHQNNNKNFVLKFDSRRLNRFGGLEDIWTNLDHEIIQPKEARCVKSMEQDMFTTNTFEVLDISLNFHLY